MRQIRQMFYSTYIILTQYCVLSISIHQVIYPDILPRMIYIQFQQLHNHIITYITYSNHWRFCSFVFIESVWKFCSMDIEEIEGMDGDWLAWERLIVPFSHNNQIVGRLPLFVPIPTSTWIFIFISFLNFANKTRLSVTANKNIMRRTLFHSSLSFYLVEVIICIFHSLVCYSSFIVAYISSSNQKSCCVLFFLLMSNCKIQPLLISNYLLMSCI